MTRSTRLYYWFHFRVWYPVKSFLCNIMYAATHPMSDTAFRMLLESNGKIVGLENVRTLLASMAYIPDKGDWRQWPSITLERGGGDCEDLALLARWMCRECLGWEASVHWLIWPNGEAHAVCVAYNPALALLDANGNVVGHPAWWQLADNGEVFSERGHVSLRNLINESSYKWHTAQDIYPPVKWQT